MNARVLIRRGLWLALSTQIFHAGALFAGTATRAHMDVVENLAPGNGSSSPQQLAVVGTRLYFSASTPGTGRETWRLTASRDGIEAVDQVRPGSDSSDPQQFCMADSRVFFSAKDDSTWRSLWVWDESSVSNCLSGLARNPDVDEVTALGDTVLFVRTDNSGDRELWRYTTSSGAKPVTNINTTASSAPASLTLAGNYVYFSAYTGSSRGLWRTDGTTVTSMDAAVGHSCGEDPVDLTPIVYGGEDLLYYSARASGVRRVWLTDGSGARTKGAATLRDPGEFCLVGDTVFFVATTDADGRELGRCSAAYNQTSAGVAADIRDVGNSNPEQLTALGDRVYITADDGENGRELWACWRDGTEYRVQMYDVYPGENVWTDPHASSPQELTVFEDKLHFSAYSSLHTGRELWRLTGTNDAGLAWLHAENPSGSSSPEHLTPFGGNLYFAASDGEHGVELWSLTGHAEYVALGQLLAPPDGTSFPTNRITTNGMAWVEYERNDFRVLCTEGEKTFRVLWDGAAKEWTYTVETKVVEGLILKHVYHTEPPSKAPMVDVSEVPYSVVIHGTDTIETNRVEVVDSNDFGVIHGTVTGDIWEGEDHRLHAKSDTGYVVIHYEDGESIYQGREVVLIRNYVPDASPWPVDVGEELGVVRYGSVSNNGMPYVAAGKMANRDDDGHIYQHLDQGPLNGNIYSVRENPDPLQMEVFWMQDGLYGVAWPYEMARYRSSWGTNNAQRLVRRRDTIEPRVQIPAELNPYKMPEELFPTNQQPPGRLAHAYLEGSEFYTDGQGFSLLLLESGPPLRRDWLDFVPVYSEWHTNQSEFVYDVTNSQFGAGMWYTNSLTIEHPIGDIITNAYHRGRRAGYICDRTWDEGRQDRYHPRFYGDPDATGMTTGHVFAVNTGLLEVWWSNASHTNTAAHGIENVAIQWPSFAVIYSNRWPDCETIWIADQTGTGDIEYDAGDWGLYYQNHPALAGFNPNDEHAVIMPLESDGADTGVFPLRCDLYSNAYDDVSEPYLLIENMSEAVPDLDVYHVQASNETHRFLAQGSVPAPVRVPYPLRRGELRICENTRIPTPESSALWKDRKNTFWSRADGGDPAASEQVIQWHYNVLSGFYFPEWYRELADGTNMSLEVDSEIPWLDMLPGGEFGTPIDFHYRNTWRTVPALYIGETLTKSLRGLPSVWNQRSAEVLYQQCAYTNANGQTNANTAVQLIDPVVERVVTGVPSDDVPDRLLQIVDGKAIFKDLPAHLRKRLTYDESARKLRFGGRMIEPPGDHYLLLNVMSEADIWAIRKAFTEVEAFGNTDTESEEYRFERHLEDELFPKCRAVTLITNHLPFANMALSTGPATGTGYVTIAFNNSTNLDLNSPGDPIEVYAVFVTNDLYSGEVYSFASDNPFDERLVMRHTSDLGGKGEEYRFEWYYMATNVEPEVDGVLVTNPAAGWVSAEKLFKFTVGTETMDFGGTGQVDIVLRDYPEFILEDNFFTCRYQALRTNSPCYGQWSDWVDPKIAESWVKRVLDGINPFEQRMRHFDTYAPGTSLTMLQQIGARYEGPVPLNLDHVDDYGLIEIYETVFNRAMTLSYEGGAVTNNRPTIDNTLLLAAGRLADLFMVLGNEAYADAADPTIGFGTEHGEYGAEASSLFCFQNITPSLLEEELALLRGRDNSVAPRVDTSPYYNRLPWNLSRDVVGGEVAYALNYELTDVTNADGDGEDGFIDEYDAAVLYPQGHGDAWGHYLSAMGHYYRLLHTDLFDWRPRVETITLGGQNLEVDYLDERKFAKAAAAKARTGAEIVSLTHRSLFGSENTGHATGYRDDNAADTNRAWGVCEWASRAGQGALLDWVAANAMLPTNSPATGMRKVDRNTVTELGEIAEHAGAIQSTADAADAGFNPLGFGRDVVPFDISPGELDQGKTHYEQVYDRAILAMVNAQAVFNHAQNASQQLRRQFDSHEDFVQNAEDREFDFRNRLIEMYGYPYDDDIGPGKTYPQGYDGPDYYHFDYVDLTALLGVVRDVEETNIAVMVNQVTPAGAIVKVETNVTVHFTTEGDFWRVKPTDWTAPRRAPGEIQLARGELIQAVGRYVRAMVEYDNLVQQISDQAFLLQEQYRVNDTEIVILNETKQTQENLNRTISRLRTTQAVLRKLATLAPAKANSIADGIPKVIGTIAGMAAGFISDLFGSARTASKTVGVTLSDFMLAAADVLSSIEQNKQQAKEIVSLESNIRITSLKSDFANLQALKQLEQLVRSEASALIGLYTEIESIQQMAGRYQSAVQKAKRIEAERLRFRKQVAAQIQDYRYKDMAFRIFRNDALQKYRAQFDMAARYAYLAARAYEYETCLADEGWGEWGADSLLTKIVKARTIGYFVDGVPEWSLYDGGLAEPLADMYWNWFVLEPQLGFSNPQTETGRFSLRQELFRVRPGSTGDETWREMLDLCTVENILAVPEFRRFCIPFNPHLDVEPGIVIDFPTTVNFGFNYFGWQAGGGDNSYDSANFATKIRSAGVWFGNYNNIQGGGLLNTPRIYLVPVGADILRTPTGDRGDILQFQVLDQVLPLPVPVSGWALDSQAYVPMQDGVWEDFGAIRRHGSFRAYHDSGMFNEAETINDSRLVGRSVWNTRWMLIIPAGTLHSDRDEGLKRFIHGSVVPQGTPGAVEVDREWRDGNGVKDIKIFFQTYAYPGI
jgi:ELWxxDGT repeat protein